MHHTYRTEIISMTRAAFLCPDLFAKFSDLAFVPPFLRDLSKIILCLSRKKNSREAQQLEMYTGQTYIAFRIYLLIPQVELKKNIIQP